MRFTAFIQIFVIFLCASFTQGCALFVLGGVFGGLGASGVFSGGGKHSTGPLPSLQANPTQAACSKDPAGTVATVTTSGSTHGTGTQCVTPSTNASTTLSLLGALMNGYNEGKSIATSSNSQSSATGSTSSTGSTAPVSLGVTGSTGGSD